MKLCLLGTLITTSHLMKMMKMTIRIIRLPISKMTLIKYYENVLVYIYSRK